MPMFRSLLTIVLSVTPVLAAAQSRPRITTAEIDGHLRFLSSDLLEGRAPATRGGRLASEYIASQLRAAGVEPGVNGSYFQRVPIDVVTADPASIVATASGRATGTLRSPDDVVIWAGSAADASAARGELVFVGYGAVAPEYKWDDFKGVDVRGKILLVLVNDPPAPAAEPALFGGAAMTYYGRWTYKFEEAERHGAAGMLIVHTTERAGYPWHTVVGSWAKEQRMLPRDPSLPAPLGVRGWITDERATSLLRDAGLDLAKLRDQAASRAFRPVATGIMLDLHFTNAVQHLASENVVGVVRGRDPTLSKQYVALSAHWDHLGIGAPANGDSIYNGASDNASGVADLLAVARAAAASPPTRRSLLFIFVTAEESGLLGSAYFAQTPTVPAAQIVANLNVDGGNLLGRTRDLNVLGDTKSSLGPQLAAMVRPQGMRISADLHPEAGHFYRSDHFSFAKAGIPAVSIGAGTDVVGRPAGWGAQQDDDYTAHRYHQPSDEYRPDFDLTGAAQLSEIVLRFAQQLANASSVPTWNRDAEFRAVRPAVQP
ncbi:MAG: M28 family peptidase [Gemmatimonadaceae bacterium]|nr:M28 family peptidase [Gemmatimonadaceae bacterium]NUO93647.1 M28 family peptidase [Gemmatimonadaceae bacterium]NUP70462.1 M28 family peptidase [Gemmatimonadaceae bacterium]